MVLDANNFRVGDAGHEIHIFCAFLGPHRL